jgi:quercetin dioxygenase-like cupin family protein
MAKLLRRDELPAYASTRDGRDRLDLLKDGIPAESATIQADRIIYHPDDTCAKHYHVGSHHLFVMLYGEATICTPLGCQILATGQVAIIPPDEVHWFENHSGENYSFVEFWAPPPEETIWIVDDDI